jgi:hypothetical protein
VTTVKGWAGQTAAARATVQWFAIIFTGKMPRGMFDFIVKAQRINVRLQSYSNLMTDQYPNVGASVANLTSSGSD